VGMMMMREIFDFVSRGDFRDFSVEIDPKSFTLSFLKTYFGSLIGLIACLIYAVMIKLFKALLPTENKSTKKLTKFKWFGNTNKALRLALLVFCIVLIITSFGILVYENIDSNRNEEIKWAITFSSAFLITTLIIQPLIVRNIQPINWI
jgi:hypothetical protein